MNRRGSPRFARAGIALALMLLADAGCKNSQRMSAGTSPGGSAAGAAAGAHAARVSIAAGGGRSVPFRVEIARTEPERNQGLMYRDRLDPDAGMIFVFERPAPLIFWMKNTFIPLDMIFIGGDRKVLGIVENAEPRTLSARRVDGLAQYVLEINGGLSAKMGIRAGDTVDLSGVPDP